jgi:hypothetical protein
VSATRGGAPRSGQHVCGVSEAHPPRVCHSQLTTTSRTPPSRTAAHHTTTSALLDDARAEVRAGARSGAPRLWAACLHHAHQQPLQRTHARMRVPVRRHGSRSAALHTPSPHAASRARCVRSFSLLGGLFGGNKQAQQATMGAGGSKDSSGAREGWAPAPSGVGCWRPPAASRARVWFVRAHVCVRACAQRVACCQASLAASLVAHRHASTPRARSPPPHRLARTHCHHRVTRPHTAHTHTPAPPRPGHGSS